MCRGPASMNDFVARGAPPPPWHRSATMRYNSGGPMSRQRRELIHVSVLGDTGTRGGWRRLCRVGLVFPADVVPLEYVYALCLGQGYRSPEMLRSVVTTPPRMLTCRPARDDDALVDVATASPTAILAQAVVLGLCTATYYDPARPVVWTTTSVTRRLDLFAVGDFYGDD